MAIAQPTILLVDDDPHARPFLARCLLSQSRYEVLAAATAAQALEISSTYPNKIDLLITDVNLGDENGQNLAARITASRPDTQVLFLSGADAAGLADRGLLDRRAAFLQKPFRPTLLLQLVGAMLETAGADVPAVNHNGIRRAGS
jgi:DNA-binding response OmpR family regulator